MGNNRILLAFFAACLTTSCVPSRMFDEMKTSKLQCDEENAKLKADMLAANTRISELDSRNNELINRTNTCAMILPRWVKAPGV